MSDRWCRRQNLFHHRRALRRSGVRHGGDPDVSRDLGGVYVAAYGHAQCDLPASVARVVLLFQSAPALGADHGVCHPGHAPHGGLLSGVPALVHSECRHNGPEGVVLLT